VRTACVVSLLLALAGCAPAQRLGYSGLSAEIPAGIGGLVGAPGGAPHPREAEAWAAFHETDAAFEALLVWPALRWDVTPKELTARLDATAAVETALVEVLQFGAAEPGIAALTRLGRVYEAEAAWLRADPVVPHRYTTRAYRAFYPLLRVFDRRAAPPWPVLPGVERLDVGSCPPESPNVEKARSAYVMAVEKGWLLGLHGNPDVRFASSRLHVLAPEAYPPRHERLPGDPEAPEGTP
jgi:hypothetical protein